MRSAIDDLSASRDSRSIKRRWMSGWRVTTGPLWRWRRLTASNFGD